MENIKCGNAFDWLQDFKAIDLILTDPPYCISRKTGFQSVKNGVERFAVNMDFGDWDANEINLDALCPRMFSSLRDGGTAIVFYDLWKITTLADAMKKAGFAQIRLIIWEKTNPVPLNSKINYLTNAREIAVLGVKKGKPTFHSEYDNGVYRHAIPNGKDGGRFHPTQKPIDLFKELIEKHSNEGDTVLDPFLGSGTTAISALRTNRKFYGCDINLEYVEIAKERIIKEEKCLNLEKDQIQLYL